MDFDQTKFFMVDGQRYNEDLMNVLKLICVSY